MVDTIEPTVYNENDAVRKLSNAMRDLGKQYSRRYKPLENGIPRARIAMPLQEGANMNHRQKLTINGDSQWISYKGAQDLVNKVTAAVQAREKAKPILFEDYASGWFTTYKKPKLDPNTADGYLCSLRNHIYPIIGNKLIDDIRAADVQEVISTFTSTSSAKLGKSIINMVIDAAIADEIYTHPNPTKDKRIVMPTAKKIRKGLDAEDMARVMELLPTLKPENARMLALMFMTGCRRGEALGARWEDIDWDKCTIHLQRVVRFRNNRPEVSAVMKTPAANRIVSLWNDFIPYLGEPKETGFIINVNGEPLTERQYRIRWEQIQNVFKAAGMQRFTAHQLRHTYATVAANSGEVPPKVLQGILGHANFQTTMNTYAGLDEDRMRESSQQISTVYAKVAAKSCGKSAQQ